MCKTPAYLLTVFGVGGCGCTAFLFVWLVGLVFFCLVWCLCFLVFFVCLFVVVCVFFGGRHVTNILYTLLMVSFDSEAPSFL